MREIINNAICEPRTVDCYDSCPVGHIFQSFITKLKKIIKEYVHISVNRSFQSLFVSVQLDHYYREKKYFNLLVFTHVLTSVYKFKGTSKLIYANRFKDIIFIQFGCNLCCSNLAMFKYPA